MSRFRRKGVSRGETPRDAFARAQGHELLGAERLSRLPGYEEATPDLIDSVLEAAAIGVPDARSGQAVTEKK